MQNSGSTQSEAAAESEFEWVGDTTQCEATNDDDDIMNADTFKSDAFAELSDVSDDSDTSAESDVFETSPEAEGSDLDDVDLGADDWFEQAVGADAVDAAATAAQTETSVDQLDAHGTEHAAKKGYPQEVARDLRFVVPGPFSVVGATEDEPAAGTAVPLPDELSEAPTWDDLPVPNAELRRRLETTHLVNIFLGNFGLDFLYNGEFEDFTVDEIEETAKTLGLPINQFGVEDTLAPTQLVSIIQSSDEPQSPLEDVPGSDKVGSYETRIVEPLHKLHAQEIAFNNAVNWDRDLDQWNSRNDDGTNARHDPAYQLALWAACRIKQLSLWADDVTPGVDRLAGQIARVALEEGDIDTAIEKVAWYQRRHPGNKLDPGFVADTANTEAVVVGQYKDGSYQNVAGGQESFVLEGDHGECRVVVAESDSFDPSKTDEYRLKCTGDISGSQLYLDELSVSFPAN
jgi:hypothetical protein